MTVETLAINGGHPAKSKPFPEWPVYDEREIEAVTKVLRSRQWWRGNGSQVVSFEREFAEYHGGTHALAVSNGTQALELMLSALNIGRGDEVIVPATTFISTASAVLCVNAVPVLVDVTPDTYCLDPRLVEAAITPRTRAIIPVHMAGHVADMDALLDIAARNNLFLIQDAAHAQGAEWKGQLLVSLPANAFYSFQAFKLMTAGEGGIIVSKDEDFIESCFLYGNCGRPKTDRTYQHTVLGSNSRMSELQASVLRVQLTRLDDQIQRREANAHTLDRLLSEIPGIVPQARDPRVTRNPHYMYMFRYDEAAFAGLPRQNFVDMLIAEGLPAFVAYLALHQTPLFRNRNFNPRWRADDPLLPDYSQVHCPVAEAISDTVVWLHHRVLLGDEADLEELAGAIMKVQYHARHVSGSY